MTDFDPTRLPLHEAARHIEAGDISSEELARALIARIEARDEAVRAWVHFDGDALIEEARALDAAPRKGPLHGVPIGLKDIIDTRDMPTRYGSPIYADHQPQKDAVVVQLLARAGALIMGKTVTTEFAYYTPRETKNPHNAAHTPGGSSSGSAAAVADFQVPAALGTQTGGSVIRPAAFCGVIGYKPAFGDIDVAGVYPFAPSFDTVGVFVRDIADVALLVDILAGRSPHAHEPVAIVEPSLPPRIALFRSHRWDDADDYARDWLEKIAVQLAQAGARLREMEVPHAFDALDAAHAAISAGEAAVTHATHWRDDRGALSDKLQELIAQGLGTSQASHEEALALSAKWRAALPTLIEPGEVLLTLSAPGEAPYGLDTTGKPIFNRAWTLLHLPCISLPAGTGPTGLPLGMQLVDPASDEAHLLAIATWCATSLDLPIV